MATKRALSHLMTSCELSCKPGSSSSSTQFAVAHRCRPTPLLPRSMRAYSSTAPCSSSESSSSSSSSSPSSPFSSSSSSARTASAIPRRQSYSAHIPLDTWQKHFLTIGSALASMINPARGDMIATLSETSGESLLPSLRDGMLLTHEGRRLLVDRPRITTKSVDMAYLEGLQQGTFGRAYVDWLEWCRVGPDTRAQVRYIDDAEQAYIMQRYRESHDFYHLLCGMPVSTLGETVVKIFEASHFGLPVAYLSSIAGPLRLSSEDRWLLMRELGPWAWEMGKSCRKALHGGTLLSMYWEERWETDMSQMKRNLGLSEPPVRVDYLVKRGMGGKKKKAWTTKTVEKRRAVDANGIGSAAASQ